MALAARLAELSARAMFGMALGLDRVRAALAEVGDPHRELAAVHVAGSNGKGSTSAMLESVARAAGLRTGLYTSPHLARFAERIRLDGEPIDDAAFEDALASALGAAGGELTFFECLTVAAFVAFRAADVDVAVVEVGLGGRLDATNVIDAPLACAITSISLEHTAVLGATLGEIAREKAGILKPGAPYVLGPVAPEVEHAIDEAARAVSAGPRWRVREGADADADVRFVRAGRAVQITGPGGRSVRAEPGLRGPHQATNAAIAAALAWHLAGRWPAVERVIEAGLAGVRWPGRFETIRARGGVAVLLDGAHNEEGAAVLAETLRDEGLSPDRVTLVFGALADKAYPAMLARLAACAERRVYTAPKGRAPAPLERLHEIAPGERVHEPSAALARAIDITPPGGAVLVTGSLYLVGELRAHLLGLSADPVTGL